MIWQVLVEVPFLHAADNIEVIKKNSIILLAVKPYALINVLELYQNELADKVIVSVASGISINDAAVTPYFNDNFSALL